MQKLLLLKKFYIIEREFGGSLLKSTKIAYAKATSVQEHYREILVKHNLAGGGWISNYLIEKRFQIINKKTDHEFEKTFRKRVNRLVMAKRTENLSKIGQRIQDMGLSLIEDEEDPNSNKTVWEKILQKTIKKSKEASVEAQKQLANKEMQGRIMNSIVEYTKLYHESVQNLLEGQREVVRDENFQFEDGKTVKEKTDAFEAFLKSKMPKFSLKHRLKIPSEQQRSEDS